MSPYSDECQFPGCGRERKYTRWCNPHWKQEKAGLDLRPIREQMKGLSCFLQRVQEQTSGCWSYMNRVRDNYSNCYYAGTSWKAHRLSYHLHTRDDITNLPIHHKCANKWCVNPNHLEKASTAENTLEMMGRKAYEAEITALSKRISELEARLSRYEEV